MAKNGYRKITAKLDAYVQHPPRNWVEYGEVCKALAAAFDCSVEINDGELPLRPWFQRGLALLSHSPERPMNNRPEPWAKIVRYHQVAALANTDFFLPFAKAFMNWAAHIDLGDHLDFGPSLYKRFAFKIFSGCTESELRGRCMTFLFRQQFDEYGDRSWVFNGENVKLLLRDSAEALNAYSVELAAYQEYARTVSADPRPPIIRIRNLVYDISVALDSLIDAAKANDELAPRSRQPFYEIFRTGIQTAYAKMRDLTPRIIRFGYENRGDDDPDDYGLLQIDEKLLCLAGFRYARDSVEYQTCEKLAANFVDEFRFPCQLKSADLLWDVPPSFFRLVLWLVREDSSSASIDNAALKAYVEELVGRLDRIEQNTRPPNPSREEIYILIDRMKVDPAVVGRSRSSIKKAIAYIRRGDTTDPKYGQDIARALYVANQEAKKCVGGLDMFWRSIETEAKPSNRKRKAKARNAPPGDEPTPQGW